MKKSGTNRTVAVLFLLVAVLIIHSCKKNNTFQFIAEGKVSDGRSEQPVSSAELEMQQQLVENGVYTTNFTSADVAQTDAEGNYHLEWEKKVVNEFKLVVTRENYFQREFLFEPDDFEIDEAVTRNVAIYPIATISVHISNVNPSAVSDQFDFRFDDTDFDCECCSEQWIYLNGSMVDTLFSCQLYGDQWLRYLSEIHTSTTDSIAIDSIWCPSFQTTNLDIEY